MRIAVVDDDEKLLEQMTGYAARVSREKQIKCTVDTYHDSIVFTESYTSVYDIIYLDIEMPGLNGFKAAQKIRETDQTVCIIFVTNMAQYAILGYEINALDFIVKPVEYSLFADKFMKAVNYLKTRREKEVILMRDEELERVRYSEIYYLEKEKNYIVYHTQKGQFRERGTIARIEEKFVHYGFSKCNSGCIVNLRHVQKTGRDSVYVQEEVLPVSRQQRRQFIGSLMRYLGGEV